MRATAIGALERLGELDAATVERLLCDPVPLVRQRAAEAAARFPEVSLLAALDDPDAPVVEMAAWACGEHAEHCEPAAVDRLCRLAREHTDPLVREAAVAALGAIGDERAVPVVLDAMADKPAIRRRAVIALTPFDGPEVTAALERARNDRDWQVRQLAEDLGAP